MNKKIIIAVFLTVIMISGAGLVLFQNNNSHITVSQNSDAINSTTTNQCNVTIGASNSGLTVPLSDLGYSDANGSSVTTSSFSSDGDITNDGSTYYISGNTLIVNTTTTITNIFIGYSLEIKSGAILTLGSGVILDENDNHNAYNNYTAGQLVINDARIHGYSTDSFIEPITAYVNNSLICPYTDINVLSGNNDTFLGNTTIGVTGTISNSHFSYNNMTTSDCFLNIASNSNNALIKNSYFQGVNGTLNDNSNMMNIQHSTISFMPSYVTKDLYGKTQLTEENVNLSYDKFIQYSGSQWDGLMLFDYSNMYNDYYNFTIPASDWSNTSIIDNAESVQLYGYGSSVRGMTNLNTTLYPVHLSHNEFAGWDGFELYGNGMAYVENNIITEQYFLTAYFNLHTYGGNDILDNGTIANNTFYFYGNEALENSIASLTSTGGNTYLTSGESGILRYNVTIEYNTFQGILGLVSGTSDEHASFILGAFATIKYNYFNVTGTFNAGSSINAPDMELDYFDVNGISNISYNKFYGLSNSAVAMAFVTVTSNSGTLITTNGVMDLYANEYKGSNSAYQITAYTGYTVDAINKTNYQYLTDNGTVTMVAGDCPNGYTANSYAINDVSISTPIVIHTSYYNVTIKENGLPSGTTWQFTFNGISKTLTNTSYTFSEKNGTYDLSVNSISGYNVNYPSTVTVNGNNQTVNVNFSSLSTTITSKNAHYYIDIIINNPKTIFYTLILNENGNITYHNLTSSNIVINVNTTDYPISINFVDLKNGYSISNPVMNYNTAGNYTLTENIISNNNINSEVNKYMPVLAIVLVFMGFMIAGAVAVKRR